MLADAAKRLLLYSVLMVAVFATSGCTLSSVKESTVESPVLIQLPPELREKYGFPVSVNEIEMLTRELHSKTNPDPVLRDLARRITEGVDSGDSELLKVQALYLYVERNWTYTESEDYTRIPSAKEVIESGFRGGSDGYSVLMTALLNAAGFETRIVFGCDESRGICRTCPEVYIGDGEEAMQAFRELSELFGDRVYYAHDPSGYWLSLDLSGEHIGGKPQVERVYLIVYPAENRWEIVSG